MTFVEDDPRHLCFRDQGMAATDAKETLAGADRTRTNDSKRPLPKYRSNSNYRRMVTSRCRRERGGLRFTGLPTQRYQRLTNVVVMTSAPSVFTSERSFADPSGVIR